MLSKEGLEKKIIKGSNEIMFFYLDKLENDIFADEVYLNCEIEKYKNIYQNSKRRKGKKMNYLII